MSQNEIDNETLTDSSEVESLLYQDIVMISRLDRPLAREEQEERFEEECERKPEEKNTTVTDSLKRNIKRWMPIMAIAIIGTAINTTFMVGRLTTRSLSDISESSTFFYHNILNGNKRARNLPNETEAKACLNEKVEYRNICEKSDSNDSSNETLINQNIFLQTKMGQMIKSSKIETEQLRADYEAKLTLKNLDLESLRQKMLARERNWKTIILVLIVGATFTLSQQVEVLIGKILGVTYSLSMFLIGLYCLNGIKSTLESGLIMKTTFEAIENLAEKVEYYGLGIALIVLLLLLVVGLAINLVMVFYLMIIFDLG